MSQISDLKMNALLSKAYEGVVLYDHTGTIIWASPSCITITGFTEKEILGTLGTDYVYQEDVEEAQTRFRSVLSSPRASVTFRQRLIHKSGHYLWAETTLSNFMHEPEVAGIISNFRNITDQKKAEDELRSSKMLLENINENINEAIYRNVPGRGFRYVNEAFLKMFGFDSLDDLNTVEPSTLYVDSELRNMLRRHLVEQKSINNMEVQFKRKDGSVFWGLISSKFVKGPAEVIYFDGAIRDITQQKMAEEKLRRSEDFLSSINRNIKEGLYRTSVEHGMIYVNDAFAEMFGYAKASDVLSTKVAALYDDPQVRADVIEALRKSGSVSNVEVKFRKKDGSTFWGLMSSYLLKRSGQEFFDGAIRDITELKKAEEKLKELNMTLQSKNEQLEAREDALNNALSELSDRNFELDQLVYKTSHDLRSPLSSILGLINISKIDQQTEKADYIDKIEMSVKRLDEFVKSMLNYAKASRSDVEVNRFNVKELIAQCIRDLEYLENFDRMEVQVTVKGDPVVFSDQLKIQIILSNIVSNAYKYMDDTKPHNFLHIDVLHTIDELSITLEDNGIGIEEQHLPRIFDMFYRATERSKGSGLGTYIVKQAVDKLGGAIHVASTPEVGTTFTISVPLTAG